MLDILYEDYIKGSNRPNTTILALRKIMRDKQPEEINLSRLREEFYEERAAQAVEKVKISKEAGVIKSAKPPKRVI